jgi:hypothetical protein
MRMKKKNPLEMMKNNCQMLSEMILKTRVTE